jgi:hypothetical protein
MSAPQSRSASLAEAAANVVVGYVVALLVQRIAHPLFGIETSLMQEGVLALLFTAVCLLRSYGLRRLFIHLEHHSRTEERNRQARLERRLATGRLLTGNLVIEMREQRP